MQKFYTMDMFYTAKQEKFYTIYTFYSAQKKESLKCQRREISLGL